MAFPSVYEMTNPLTTVRKQHFWDYFSGSHSPTGSNTEGTRWRLAAFRGATATAAMQDEVNGGLKLSSSGNASALQMDDVRQFSNTGSVNIWSTKNTSGCSCAFGLARTSDGYFNSGIWTDVPTTAGGNINFYTADSANSGVAYSSTTKAITTAQSYHTYKMEQKSTTAHLSIDGVLDVDRTTASNRPMPDQRMQPVAQVYNSTGGLFMNYFEAYNT